MGKLGRTEFSSSNIKMSAKTGPRSEPMAIPSACTYVLDSKVKWTFFVHNISIYLISFFVTDVAISFFSYILFKIMSIVRFNGTFVNKDLTSNNTILCSLDNFCYFNSSMNSLVFFTVFLDYRKGDNNLERYFAKFYVAVFRFTIYHLPHFNKFVSSSFSSTSPAIGMPLWKVGTWLATTSQ